MKENKELKEALKTYERIEAILVGNSPGSH